MAAGRKPQPTKLKEVKGNPGKRPLPKDEPKVSVEAPEAPEHLSDEAAEHWDVVVRHLYEAGVMTALDADALAMYCEAYARWVDANAKIRKHGPVVKTPNGFPAQSPYLQVANKAFEQMRSILTEFGMTPSSRTRISAGNGDGKNGNPFGQLG
jgi:P27 family predicted phage terminase small subunit